MTPRPPTPGHRVACLTINDTVRQAKGEVVALHDVLLKLKDEYTDLLHVHKPGLGAQIHFALHVEPKVIDD